MTASIKGHARFAATLGAAAILAVALSSCTSASGEGSTVDTGTIGGAAAGGIAGALVSKNPLVIGGLAVAGGIAGNEFIDKPRAEKKRQKATAERDAEKERDARRRLEYERQSELQKEEVRQQIEEQRLYEEWKQERVRSGQDGAGGETVDVAGAQRLLKAHGLYQGPVDGVLGPATEEAVRRFESKQGRQQTGRLTPSLMSQMRATL